MILVVDFGGQSNQLIARKVRDLKVYCEVVPFNKALNSIEEKKPTGIIFTGGANSIYEEKAPKIEKEVFECGIPILALDYGTQLMVQALGGKVKKVDRIEFGEVNLNIEESVLFKNIENGNVVWINNVDIIEELPEGFKSTASTKNSKIVAMENIEKNLFGFQFHPEVNNSKYGKDMLANFVYGVCGEKADWTMANYAKTAIDDIKKKVGDGKVLLALSGGVDSSVTAALLSKAIGNKLTCIFVDHGFMRKNEGDEVEEAFKDSGMNFIRVNAEDRFLNKLKGITDPEEKRKAIGEEFIRVFEDEGRKIKSVDYLAQGTIYPDIIESGVGDGAVIKSHHNVGGLPDVVDFKDLVEPLKMLFKDEVRELGRELGLPNYLVDRQPFPGPGLGIRVIGEITKDKLDILRDADYIFREELEKAGLSKDINQYFAVLTNNRTVGVKEDIRTYDYTLALRAVETTDFMTAEWSRIPYEILDKVSRRIVDEVEHINRIVYDITSKPPATIEWE
ncbi:glutamine-hydrolyzing GMP synthase [Anaerosphaera multitolerans]|uniref:GMP synthase [glutamine-hydrolyzing] n=1 Tax=Anaerosphaera multitolerans TaxID=2487351 RepID=A0A437S636_9FIRM|nr:glutamine-hydrolyzing GMP synthase [Anaerosphaera multitolerans]RVU54448.1 glutamine-hydrolyzing GMP synthase [Anaerosphaera multitolerans]